MLYIGVDLGTSAVKLLLMDGAGHIEKIVSREYPIYFPHPWSVQTSPPDSAPTSPDEENKSDTLLIQFFQYVLLRP